VTEGGWWALHDEDPGAFPWPIFADWLAERGDPRERAAREVGRRGWVPYECDSGKIGFTWDWYLTGRGWGFATGKAQLDDETFAGLRGHFARWETCREYPTAADACRALLAALSGVEPAPAPVAQSGT
jgi:hypothetical protein